MSYGSVLVTGANRGIGLEFVKQFVKSATPPKYVFATYRSKDTVQALEQIRDSSSECQVILIQMDVTKKADVESMQKTVEDHVGEEGLNLLINNAGALKPMQFPELTEEDLLFHFTVNTVGPVLVLQAVLPLLKKAVAASKETSMSVFRASVLNISTVGGSIAEADKQHVGWLHVASYRTSKAAMNMVMRNAAIALKDQGIQMVNMCPGWVRTDLGTKDAPIDATESVSSMLATLSTLDESQHGVFMDRNGQTIPY